MFFEIWQTVQRLNCFDEFNMMSIRCCYRASSQKGRVMGFEKYQIWNNMRTIVFDPQRMSGSDQFADEVGAFVGWVKSSPLRNPEDPVMMPGEPEQSCREKRGASPGRLSAVATP
jgi:hypothetical protein